MLILLLLYGLQQFEQQRLAASNVPLSQKVLEPRGSEKQTLGAFLKWGDRPVLADNKKLRVIKENGSVK